MYYRDKACSYCCLDCENRTQSHAVYLSIANAISALYVDGKLMRCGLMDEGQVRIEVLLRAQLNPEIVCFSEIHKQRK